MDKPYGKYNDLELCHALCGDKKVSEAAFAELYSRYSQRIYAYCLRVTGSAEDSKDIFQETFLKFFDSTRANKDIDNISAYLLTIARNMCINYKRNNKITYSIEDFNVAINDEEYERKELLQLIARAMEVLEFEYREAFVLRQYHGLSYEEISLITGETMYTVKNRAWRAKEKIKNILEPYLEDLSK